MKKLFIQFSDGEYYHGEFFLFKAKSFEHSYKVNNVRAFQFSMDTCIAILPENSQFTYNLTSVVKFSDMTTEEFKLYSREQKLKTIL